MSNASNRQAVVSLPKVAEELDLRAVIGVLDAPAHPAPKHKMGCSPHFASPQSQVDRHQDQPPNINQ